MRVRDLHLYGELAERFGAVHPVAADTMPAAIRIVECNHPGFAAAVRKGNFHIALGASDLDEARELPPHHLFVPRSKGDWHLVPALTGGKSQTTKAIFSIVVGGALLATGIGGAVAGGAFSAGGATTSAAFAASSGFLGISLSTVTMLGAATFLGGISQLLAPAPKGDTAERKPTSFSFDGPGEVDDEGGPIHIICGEVITGGIKAAQSIESSQSASLSQFSGGDAGLKQIFGDGYSARVTAIQAQ